MKSTILLIGIALGVFSFSGGSFKVEHKGALRNIMHKGDLSAKADLGNFQDREHFFALGAVENLKGEILILDSKPYVSSVLGDQLVIENSFEKKAALLVYVAVSEWNSEEIPRSVSSQYELEKYVEKMATNHGINTGEPFPFLIEGRIKSGDWHVIDWRQGDTVHTHEKHLQSGLQGTISDQKVTILGFWSNKHHAVFTHHSTNIHMHFKTEDGNLAGHLDDLRLGKRMVLKLPRMK